jgi:inosose dehydratase
VTNHAHEGSGPAIAVANAPVSYGAFELTIGIDPNVPSGDMVLDEVAAAGYSGIDLGPVGYLGESAELARVLASRRLGLSGGFLELPFDDATAMEAAMRSVDMLLDVFDSVEGQTHKPRPTLADIGSDARRAQPGRAAKDHGLGFDSEGWKRFADGVEMATARCRERGYEPTFHHESGTRVEAEWEIEKVLELTSIGLCLDTGHLLVGGGDPARAARDWSKRINHLHVKDARQDVIDDIVTSGAHVMEVWKRPAFCRLGDGDVDVDGVLDALRPGYSGWLVVEQDVLPHPDAGRAQGAPHDRLLGRPAADQRANREYLAARGL